MTSAAAPVAMKLAELIVMASRTSRPTTPIRNGDSRMPPIPMLPISAPITSAAPSVASRYAGLAKSGSGKRPLLRRVARRAAHRVELVVGPHRDQVRHPVRKREEGGDRADVPDVLVTEAVAAQRREVGIVDRAAVQRDLHREREYRLLPRRDVGLPVIDGDLVGDERVFRVDPQDRAVR